MSQAGPRPPAAAVARDRAVVSEGAVLSDDEVAPFVAGLGLPGIIDTHVHFMPDAIQQAVWRHFDALEPTWPVAYREPAEDRLDILGRLGVRHHTALAYAHRPGTAAWLNQHTMALGTEVAQVIPSFTIYPEPGMDDEVAACLAAGGACVKVHLQVGRFDANDPLLDGSWAQLETAGTPVVIHAGAVDDGSGGEAWCGPDPVARLLERFPGLRLVVAHLGAPDFGAFLDLARRHPLVMVDTAMVFGSEGRLGSLPDDLPDRLAALGDRVVWGSDFPTIPSSYGIQMTALIALGLGEDWYRAVLWHNPARLFGLDGEVGTPIPSP